MSNDNIDRPSMLPSPSKDGWERTVLENLVFATLKEQRTQRRWGIFFKLLTFAIVIFSIWQFSDLSNTEAEISGRHVALINIDGAIDVHGNGAAETVIPALNRAYENTGSVGVILHINSPGGSPVQAGMINDEIEGVCEKYLKK
jgi:protease-4